MPPPPPPPPGPVPIPALNNANPSKQSANDPTGRSALLESIRTGKSLKKSVTNDRSAPLVEGSKSGGPATLNGPRNGTTCGGSVPMGGLFQGGIPKLRPTGSRPGNSGPATGPLIPQIKKPASTVKKWQPPNTNPPASNAKPPSPVMNNSQPPRKWNSVTDDISNRGQAPMPPSQTEKPRFGSMNNVAEQNLQNNSRGESISPSTLRPGPPLPSKPPALKRQNSSPGPSFNKPPPTKGPLLINGPPLPPALPKRPANLKRPSSTELQSSQVSSGVKSSPLPRETSVPNLNQIISRALPAAPTQTREQPPPPPLPTNAIRMQPPPPPPVSTLPRPHMGVPPPPPKVPPSVRPPPPPTRNVTDSGTAGSVPPPPPHRVLANTLVRGQPPPPPVRNTSNRFSTQVEDLESRFSFRNISDFPSPDPFSGAMKRYPSKNPRREIAGIESRSRMPPLYLLS